MQTKLSGKAILEGQPVGFVGHQTLDWKLQMGHWNLIGWHSHSMKLSRSVQKIFLDVTAEAITNEDELKHAQRSFHEEFIQNVIQTGKMPSFGKYTSFIDAASPHALPSVSVVDIDNDSWDDLFISACSVFIDLDNDGDQDAIIGRSLEPVLYLENDQGKFIDVTEAKSNLGKRFMVSAISVSDINRDGLPDLYFSTYGPFGQNEPGRHIESSDWRNLFLTKDEKKTLAQKHKEGHGYVDNAGQPNFIAVNRGNGKLEVVNGDELIAQWHHSYQSAWADVDGDGDDDLYVTNDFAKDGFLLNVTPAGSEQPKFSDSLETHSPGGGVGFGMGASWGDFDVDGDLDLYVSNMYSKAGARILKQLGSGDPRMEIATRGNFLYENVGGVFQNKTGSKTELHNIGKVGWSYGGQFLDVDNNGFLDLYVPSGYFSAPSVGDSEVDI